MNRKEIGFEFEIGSPWGMKNTCDRIRRDLGITGLKPQADCTVVTPQKYNGEIATPVWSFRQGMVNLKRIFKWFEKNGIVTNQTCGFHVNLSYKVKELNWMLDLSRLVLCFNEEKWLKLCSRMDNEYAECHIDRLILNRGKRKFADEKKAFKWVGDAIEESMDEKFRSVNIERLEGSTPYVEYRCLGGNGYHLRNTVMMNAIVDMSKNMDRALPEGRGTGFMTTKVRECFLSRKKVPVVPH